VKTTQELGHLQTWNPDETLPNIMPSRFIGSAASLFPMDHIQSRLCEYPPTCNGPMLSLKDSLGSNFERFGNNCVDGKTNHFFFLSFVVVVTLTGKSFVTSFFGL
jgi:hypothetical protein